MARMVILRSGSWADLTLAELAPKVAEWGYQGVELCGAGDHFDAQRALAEPDYCQTRLDALNRHDLTAPVLNAGAPQLSDMATIISAAQRLGAATLAGLTGTTLCLASGDCAPSPDELEQRLNAFVLAWKPMLDACGQAGLRFAAQVQPGQMAFDLHSAAWVLEALEDHEAFGFTFDPAVLHWQGVDPAEFVRRFPERIYHVHLKDVAIRLNGRNGLLGCWPAGDPRRGFEYRSPGHGGLDWESVIRALDHIGYDGPLAVDWQDPLMDRDWGAEDACKFLQRLDFPFRRRDADGAFRL